MSRNTWKAYVVAGCNRKYAYTVEIYVKLEIIRGSSLKAPQGYLTQYKRCGSRTRNGQSENAEYEPDNSSLPPHHLGSPKGNIPKKYPAKMFTQAFQIY